MFRNSLNDEEKKICGRLFTIVLCLLYIQMIFIDETHVSAVPLIILLSQRRNTSLNAYTGGICKSYIIWDNLFEEFNLEHTCHKKI